VTENISDGINPKIITIETRIDTAFLIEFFIVLLLLLPHLEIILQHFFKKSNRKNGSYVKFL